jgi:hypothetical protein
LTCLPADLEKAVRDVVGSSHRNSGQTCICTNRVLVHVSAACRLLKQLMGRAVLLALPLLLPSLQAGMHAATLRCRLPAAAPHVCVTWGLAAGFCHCCRRRCTTSLWRC